VHDRRRGQAHIAARDDRAGALVDDDARATGGRHLEVLERCHEVDRAPLEAGRDLDLHGAAIGGARGVGELGVDGLGDARGDGEARDAELEPEGAALHDRDGDLALDDRALGDASGVRGALLHRRAAVAARVEAAEHEAALGDRIRLLVTALQHRLDERAADERPGIADRRDGDVDLRALLRECRQLRRHHHGGDVAEADLVRVDLDAEAPEHREHRLGGERNADVVSRARQAGDEPVADELVLSGAPGVDEIAQAVSLRVGRPEEDAREHGEHAENERKTTHGGAPVARDQKLGEAEAMIDVCDRVVRTG
jgi:hypothetical protein